MADRNTDSQVAARSMFLFLIPVLRAELAPVHDWKRSAVSSAVPRK